MNQTSLYKRGLGFIVQPAVQQPLILDGRSIGRCWNARSFLARLRGIRAFDRLQSGEALLFERCSSVHGFRMQRALDVVFVDREWHVVKVTSLGINKLAKCKCAHAVFEFELGSAALLGLTAGRRLKPDNVLLSGDVQAKLIRQGGE